MTETRSIFRTVIRGYDPLEVDRRIAELTDAAVAAQQHASDLHTQVERLSAQPTVQVQTALPPPPAEADFAALGVHIGQILTAAKGAAAEIRQQAEGEAKESLAASRLAISKARADADRQASASIEDAKQTAGKILEEARQRVVAQRKEIELLRAQTERASEEAKRKIGATTAEAEHKAAQLVADATAEAERIRSASEHELAVATDHRDTVLGQLGSIRQVLASVLFGDDHEAAKDQAVTEEQDAPEVQKAPEDHEDVEDQEAVRT